MLFQLLRELEPYRAKLVAVSKTKPVEAIQVLYDEGQRIFGENRVQEIMEKADRLPSDIQWHMIGHLQTNKIKYIAPFIHLIQSVDRPKLLHAIQIEAAKINRIIPHINIPIHPTRQTNWISLGITACFWIVITENVVVQS